jgi:hypothetical protein
MAGCRKWLGAGLLGAVLCAGCDPATMMYFLTPETKEAPELRRLASEDKKKEVKVVILAYPAMDLRAEFIQADRELTFLLARQLTELARANEEKLVVVPPRRVEEYKNQHPSRHGWDPTDIGKYFQADYVIYLELNRMSLYEVGAGNQLLRGRADISVSLIDMHSEDQDLGKEQTMPFTCLYPSDSRGPIAESLDTPAGQFRQQFLAYVAKRLSWYFAPHQKRDREVQLD